MSFHFIASYVCFTRFTCAFLLVLQEKSGLHLRDVESGFTGWPFACTGGVYEAIGFDRMHVMKGLIERMWDALNSIIRDECPEGTLTKTYLATKHAKMDTRLSFIMPFLSAEVYVPRFTGGIYSKNQMEAWHYSAWLSLIPFAITDGSSIIRNATSRAHFLECMGLLREVVFELGRGDQGHSKDDLKSLQHAVKLWRSSFIKHYKHTSKSEGNHDNFHKITHLLAHAERDGGFSSTCTGHFEKSHVMTTKKPAMSTNGGCHFGTYYEHTTFNVHYTTYVVFNVYLLVYVN